MAWRSCTTGIVSADDIRGQPASGAWRLYRCVPTPQLHQGSCEIGMSGERCNRAERRRLTHDVRQLLNKGPFHTSTTFPEPALPRSAVPGPLDLSITFVTALVRLRACRGE